MQGIESIVPVEEWGAIYIRLEQEPLEALKLGTYVGSCLGLGGSLTYSAVAIVLDINKQVLYARDRQGVVVARQVVAISDSEQLVCFEVYPHSVDAIIKTLFREYNERFAEALGLDMYRENADREYAISLIMSEHWWNDMAWNFSAK